MSRLGLIHISRTINTRSSLIHLHGFRILVLLLQLIEITTFICTNGISFISKSEILFMLVRQESFTSQKRGSRNFWPIANGVLHKGKSAIPKLFNGPEFLSPASGKEKLQKSFRRIRMLMTQVSFYLLSLLGLIWNCIIFMCLPISLRRSWSTLNCRRCLVLAFCGSEKVWAWPFKEPCLKLSSVVPVFQNVGERSMAKNYRPVRLHSDVIRVFENF